MEIPLRYESFRIRNFKGIKDTTVNLETVGSASVFAFVGLNESGKTTVLEAIHSFSPDAATSELLGGKEGIGVPYNERAPRHLISSFTGDVSVKATVSVSADDKAAVAAILMEEHKLSIDLDTFPDKIILERQQRFKDGDFQGNYFTLRTVLKVKSKGQRKWREPDISEATHLRNRIYVMTPDIAYFPTFVFDFPKSIFLTSRGSVIDRFYRRVFQDILDFDGRGHTIEKDIVRRVRSERLVVAWLKFLTLWNQNEERTKIQHVMDRAGAIVTRVVFGRWNKIFGEDTRGKEVIVSFDIEEGEIRSKEGVLTKTDKHDVYIKFQIRDGTRRFDVNDRSLGFRWFFAFMLFTQFRVARASSRPLLFLFDEPASNLHAAAQQKLVDCFPEIARGDHTLAYTTHSHYMIEPKWLEQTFIVTNRADTPKESVLDEISLDDESLDIKVATYRSFVNDHSGQTSYFQPILDRLDVVPSKFDMQKASIVVEGKSDYYILRYASKLHGRLELPLLPGLGAGTFGALASLSVGWALNFIFVLDADSQGRAEQARYVRDFGLPAERVVTLGELHKTIVVVEDLLNKEALVKIQGELELKQLPTKAQILRFFQERLASDQIADLGAHFRDKSGKLLDALSAKLLSSS